MKRIPFLILPLFLTQACDYVPQIMLQEGLPPKTKILTPPSGKKLIRYIDEEAGVVCYAYVVGEQLSCVKMDESSGK